MKMILTNSQEPNYSWIEADNKIELAQMLASEIAVRLNCAIESKGRAIIAFSGGSTPKPLFDALLNCNIDWSSVIVTLVDERWVPYDHALSNARFLIENLLSNLANPPRFVSLFNISAGAMSASSSLTSVLVDYCGQTESSPARPAVFDIAILGMGSDAHTASFFPDAENVKELINPHHPNFLDSCCSPSSQVDRVTWTLPMLQESAFLALHFTGEEKRAVFEHSLVDNDATAMPIRSVLFNPQQALQVYYCV